jgi:tetratricopeptide (TPR) repeat protein
MNRHHGFLFPVWAPLLSLVTLVSSPAAHAGAGACPAYVRHSPGGDYTNADDREGLEVVERFHFTAPVETLAHGVSGSLGDDISYTLEHFPNHHKALAALAKLGLREKTVQPAGAKYTITCYFDRAIRFVPGDAKVRQVYGAYLLAGGQTEQALEQLEEAAKLDPNNPTTNYNLGLMYIKKKDYARARAFARKAYALDFPLTGLKNKLIAAGQWSAGDEAR